MEDIPSNQIKTSLLTNEADHNQSKTRASTQPIDLQQGFQNIQDSKHSNNTNQEQNEDSIIINQEVFLNNNNNGEMYSFGGQVGRRHRSIDNLQQRQQQRNQQDQIGQENNSVNNLHENEHEDEQNENIEDENEIPQNLEMSNLFLSIFKDNKLFVVAVIFCDLIMGSIAMFVYNKRCSLSDLQQWNYQWGYYFFAKAIYHFLVYLQFYSSSRKLDICEKLGEYITADENNVREFEYQMSYTERQRTQIRRSLEKQFLDYYYKRNSLLKWSYYIKSLITLTYVIYGMVVFFKGNYFSIWISNSSSQTQQSCDYTLTWWVYLSIILVIACNRQIFDLILIIAIIIPILVFIYLPYMIYRNCKQKRKRKQIFQNFKNIKYTVGKLQGETECTICRMDYIIDEQITILPCNELHHFHKDCIMSWLKVNMTCPLCRHNFGEEPENEEENNQNQQDQNQYVPPPLPNQQQNQQQGQLVFSNPMQQQQQQNNNQHQDYQDEHLHQQQENEAALIQQILVLCDAFPTQRELQVFLEQNQYPPEVQRIYLQIYQQRRAGQFD